MSQEKQFMNMYKIETSSQSLILWKTHISMNGKIKYDIRHFENAGRKLRRNSSEYRHNQRLPAGDISRVGNENNENWHCNKLKVSVDQRKQEKP